MRSRGQGRSRKIARQDTTTDSPGGALAVARRQGEKAPGPRPGRKACPATTLGAAPATRGIPPTPGRTLERARALGPPAERGGAWGGLYDSVNAAVFQIFAEEGLRLTPCSPPPVSHTALSMIDGTADSAQAPAVPPGVPDARETDAIRRVQAGDTAAFELLVRATSYRRSRWPIEWSVTGKTPRTWCRRPSLRRWATSGRSTRRAGSAPGSTGSWSRAGSTSGRLGAAEPPRPSMTRSWRAANRGPRWWRSGRDSRPRSRRRSSACPSGSGWSDQLFNSTASGTEIAAMLGLSPSTVGAGTSTRRARPARHARPLAGVDR